MRSRCAVLIAAQAQLPALTERLSTSSAEVLAFADTDVLRALDAIANRRPDVIALERGFATTTRGAALINRLAADPALAHSAVRILAHGHADQTIATAVDAGALPEERPAAVAADAAGVDARGTRRVPRLVLAGQIDTTIDGNAAALIDLSTLGAQVVSATSLRPNQRVRLVLSDGTSTIRMTGAIVWATFEIPPGSGPRYRAGLEFVNPDQAAIDGFCRTHRP